MTARLPRDLPRAPQPKQGPRRPAAPEQEWSPAAAAAPLLYRARPAAPLAAIYSPFIPLGQAREGGASALSLAKPRLAAILVGLGEAGQGCGGREAGGWRGCSPRRGGNSALGDLLKDRRACGDLPLPSSGQGLPTAGSAIAHQHGHAACCS